MITNPTKHAERHKRICAQGEQEFSRRQAQHRKLTLEDEVRGLAAAVAFFIKRGSTSHAEVVAIACAHMGIKLAAHALSESSV